MFKEQHERERIFALSAPDQLRAAAALIDRAEQCQDPSEVEALIRVGLAAALRASEELGALVKSDTVDRALNVLVHNQSDLDDD